MGLVDEAIGTVFGVASQGVGIVGGLAGNVLPGAGVDVEGGQQAAAGGLTGDLGLAGLINAPVDLVGGVVGQATGLVTGILGGGGAIDTTGFSGGNGRFKTRTTVETLDTMTGKIVKLKRMPGSPHMMNTEITAAKKVFRQSAKLHSRMPRRTVRESNTTKLKDAAVDAAIRKAQTDDCPPKCS